jgi:hypothetical protein
MSEHNREIASQADPRVEEGRELYKQAQLMAENGDFESASRLFSELAVLKLKIENPSWEGTSEYSIKIPTVYEERGFEDTKKKIEEDIESARSAATGPENFESLRRLGMYNAVVTYTSIPEFRYALEVSGASPEILNEIVEHENSHASKAEVLGCDVRYQIYFVKFPDGIRVLPEVAFKYPSLSVETNNAIKNAVALAPERLSSDDTGHVGIDLPPEERRLNYVREQGKDESSNLSSGTETIEENGYEEGMYDLPDYTPEGQSPISEEELAEQDRNIEAYSIKFQEALKDINAYVESVNRQRNDLKKRINDAMAQVGDIFSSFTLPPEYINAAEKALQELNSVVVAYEAMYEGLNKISKDRLDSDYFSEDHRIKHEWGERIDEFHNDVYNELGQAQHLRDRLKWNLEASR